MAEYIEFKAIEKMLENAQIISDGENCGYCTADISIWDIPKVDVAPVVHGEWVAEFDLAGSTFYRCSVCDRQEVLLTKEDVKECFPYCHCGAKMDEVKQSNKLRVWHIPQIPMKAFYVDVASLEEAIKILGVLCDYDLFQYENKVKPDYCNIGGLEEFDEVNNTWSEWHSEDDLSIWELIDSF